MGAHPQRPPRLILLLGGDVLTGLHDLAELALQVPTVALAIATGLLLSAAWLHRRRRPRAGSG